MRRKLPISTFEGVIGRAALYSMRANIANVSNVRHFEGRPQKASNANIPNAAAGADYAGGPPCQQKRPFFQQVLVRAVIYEVRRDPELLQV